MRFPAEIDISQSGDTIHKFIAITGWEIWLKRINELVKIAHKNPLLEDYLALHHGIELALFQVIKHEKETGHFPVEISAFTQYRLYTLAMMVTGFYDWLDRVGQERIGGMIRDGLKREDGFLAIEHEMAVASHCMMAGFDVEPIDIQGKGRADFLITKDDIEVEVECKLLGHDIGQPILRKPMAELGNRFLPMLNSIQIASNIGYLVNVTLDGRFDGGDDTFYESITFSVRNALIDESTHVVPRVATISIKRFLADSTSRLLSARARKKSLDSEAIRNFVKSRFGQDNEHMFFQVKGNGAIIIIVVTSLNPLRLLDRAYERLKEAAENQLNSARPGILVVKLPGLTPAGLRHIASIQSKHGKHNALQLITTRLFRHARRAHLHSVSFQSAGVLRRTKIYTDPTSLRTSISEEGASYTFFNTSNGFATDTRLNIFRAQPISTAY